MIIISNFSFKKNLIRTLPASFASESFECRYFESTNHYITIFQFKQENTLHDSMDIPWYLTTTEKYYIL